MSSNPSALVLRVHHTPTRAPQPHSMTQSCQPLPGLWELRAQIPPLHPGAPPWASEQPQHHGRAQQPRTLHSWVGSPPTQGQTRQPSQACLLSHKSHQPWLRHLHAPWGPRTVMSALHHRAPQAPGSSTATCVTHSTCGRHCHRLWSLASTDGEPPACPTPAGVGTLLQLLTAEHRGAEGAHLISGATCDGSMNRAQPPAGSIPNPRDGPATHCGAEPGNSTVRSGSAEPSVSERLASGTGQRAGPISCPPSSGEAGPSARTRARQGGAGRAAPAPGSEQRARCRCL